ncbi:hypothetical protein FGIG_12151 [Fasciola gigantica]|uniref:Uncharacterized protein n=1 Tax=Fasciola gigantica TaxID=46835 RepID=A0A504YV64_FASGI|nr:hypothetical protein FGIG_12151 [Fasciola gigantica]
MSMRTLAGLLLLVVCLRGMNMQISTTDGTNTDMPENESGSSTTESSAMQSTPDTTVSPTTQVPVQSTQNTASIPTASSTRAIPSQPMTTMAAQSTSVTGGSIRPLIETTRLDFTPRHRSCIVLIADFDKPIRSTHGMQPTIRVQW